MSDLALTVGVRGPRRRGGAVMQSAGSGPGPGPDDDLRRLLARLLVVEEQTRAVAQGLESMSSDGWESVAAQRFRQQLGGQAAAIRQAAVAVDGAVRALAAHCAAVSQ